MNEMLEEVWMDVGVNECAQVDVDMCEYGCVSHEETDHSVIREFQIFLIFPITLTTFITPTIRGGSSCQSYEQPSPVTV